MFSPSKISWCLEFYCSFGQIAEMEKMQSKKVKVCKFRRSKISGFPFIFLYQNEWESLLFLLFISPIIKGMLFCPIEKDQKHTTVKNSECDLLFTAFSSQSFLLSLLYLLTLSRKTSCSPCTANKISNLKRYLPTLT